MTDLIVCGFVKSGNTHLARLLGDVFDSPVMGIGSAHPIAEEGLYRDGPHTVRQLHMLPTDREGYKMAIVDAWTFSLLAWEDERVFWIVRDPRDVAVSMMFYWELESVGKALRMMAHDADSVFRMSWDENNERWFEVFEVENKKWPCRMVRVHYENLVEDPLNELVQNFAILSLQADESCMVRAIEKNRFSARKADIEQYGDDKSRYPSYHKGIQRKNLRKGEPGDWVNHFHKKDAEYAEDRFGKWMRYFGYTSDASWVEGVK